MTSEKNHKTVYQPFPNLRILYLSRSSEIHASNPSKASFKLALALIKQHAYYYLQNLNKPPFHQLMINLITSFSVQMTLSLSMLYILQKRRTSHLSHLLIINKGHKKYHSAGICQLDKKMCNNFKSFITNTQTIPRFYSKANYRGYYVIQIIMNCAFYSID